MTAFPPHFDGERFFNPDAPQARGFFDALKWKWTSRPEGSQGFVDDVATARPPARVEGAQLRVTMVNHSTVLIQQNGVNVLTDPIWSERASPVSWAGPRRLRAPGVRWEDLPAIDIVLLSHNHYDHLDARTIRRLTVSGRTGFVAPLKLAPLLESLNVEPVHELDWGGSVAIEETTIHCVPAMHFSARGLFDRNRTLWCGYMIETAGRLIYFAGDTAFGEHFAQIRKRFGAPALALLPIGAYAPRWFMSAVHMGPEEALRARSILGAETAIAIHHGTFQLADEGIDTPARTLAELEGGSAIRVLKNGESAVLE
jgi:L-ascorbate metabolism protein UlaG (beta-lactamase superfamily)